MAAGAKKSRARKRRARAQALVAPDTCPSPAQDQPDLIPPPSSSTPAAAVHNGASISSPAPSAQQVTPTPAAAAAASYPASPTSSVAYQPVQAAVPGETHLAPASSSSASAAQDQDKFNYAKRGEKLYGYLKSNEIYGDQLSWRTYMNEKNKTSNPYTIRVFFKDMIKLKAHADLISDICNSLKSLYIWIIPAAEKFLADNDCVNQEPNSGNPCISFSGFPDSMQTFADFTKNITVSDVNGVLSLDGRLLIEMPMVTMLENHLQKKSWNGRFSTDDILIIKISQRGRVTYEMKILQKPVELKGSRLLESRCNDLRKCAQIFMPLYTGAIHCPVYILVLKEDLEKPEKFIKEIGFMKYLTHHPAIMPSTGRITFLTKLNGVMVDSYNLHYDWTIIVESEYEAKKLDKKDIIHVLWKVYCYNNDNKSNVYKKDKGSGYKNTGRELLRFMRNVFEHGDHDKDQLDLYLAKMFSSFFPSLMRSLLMSEIIMEKGYQPLWSEYEVSKLIKINGMQAQVVTTD